MVDGPSKKEGRTVPRTAIALSQVTLLDFVIEKLPKAAGTGAVSRAWEKADVDSKVESSSIFKKRVKSDRRKDLTDFERFKVMRLKKQVSDDEPETAEIAA